MNLKGETKIQLMDAKTGEVVAETSDTNLVTDAVDNILNGALNYVYLSERNGYSQNGGLQYLNYLYNNMAKDFFGGVLIFSKEIEESTSHIIPSGSEIDACIGCANQTAAITGNTYKGSVNTSETEITTEYAKFVWDFTTEQCNGDIAAICLTSNLGGATGLKFDAKDAYCTTLRTLASTSNFYNAASLKTATVSNRLTRMKTSNSNNHGYLCDDKNIGIVYGNTLYTRAIGVARGQKLRLTSSLKLGAITTTTDDVTTTLTTELYNYIKTVGSDLKYAYGFKGNSDYDENSLYRATITRYDLDGNETKYKALSATLATNYKSFIGSGTASDIFNGINRFIYNGVLYLVAFYIKGNGKTNKCRIYKVILDDGTFTYADTELTDSFVTLFCGSSTFTYGDEQPELEYCFINDSVYLAHGNDSYYAYFRLNLDDLTINTDATINSYGNITPMGNMPIDNIVSAPWFVSTLATDLTQAPVYYGSLVLFTPYLATINNLSQVLTKTPEYTMKVIYTITQANN
jgi:hypothetical protein